MIDAFARLMIRAAPSVALATLVGLLLAMRGTALGRALFRWLPIPLWCYAVPMVLRTAGWLPRMAGAYAWHTAWLFPIALGLLLLGVDLSGIRRVGTQAATAMIVGTAGIVLGAPLLGYLFRGALPPDAWKGIGTLAATWTGGSMNMVALQTVLDVPASVFSPLVVVDALVAYSWMACLVACKGIAPRLDRWLRVSASSASATPESASDHLRIHPRQPAAAMVLAIALAVGCRFLGQRLPLSAFVSSATSWTVLLVTAAALALACAAPVRRLGAHGTELGYLGLYLVLASLGAQASLTALAATPAWILVGIGCVLLHGAILLAAGRLFRLPFGILAVASQADVGGVVSAPLVGAVYHPSLAPVGLVLALLGNAVGTFLGLLSAGVCRWLMAS